MRNTETLNPNLAIIGKLSIERCQTHLAHLHALLYLCCPRAAFADSVIEESLIDVMASIEHELAQSARLLGMLE